MPCYCWTVACFCTSHLKEEILIFRINLIPKETNAEEISPEHLKNLNPARQLRWCLISQHYDRASLSAPPLSMCKCQNKSLFPFCWATPHHRHGQKLLRRLQTQSETSQELYSWLSSLKLPWFQQGVQKVLKKQVQWDVKIRSMGFLFKEDPAET